MHGNRRPVSVDVGVEEVAVRLAEFLDAVPDPEGDRSLRDAAWRLVLMNVCLSAWNVGPTSSPSSSVDIRPTFRRVGFHKESLK